MSNLSRREFVGLAAVAGVAALGATTKAPASQPTANTPAPAANAEPAPPPAVADEFPTQTPALTREMVGVSHGNVARVKELLALHPTLANATWDWGFGDWENALGAASHVGNVEIARMLLANGARPTIFSATMLGQLAVVKAFVEASPGVQGTRGPHGITLLAHARFGGEPAKPVYDYLVSIGGADPVPAAVELPPELAAKYTGTFEFGPRPADRIEISFDKGSVKFLRTGMTPRNLVHLGDNAFHPPGAPAVRVRFVMADDKVAGLTINDPDVVLRAKRVV